MITIHNGKVIGNGERFCKMCGKVKPFTEFYVKSGYGTAEHPAVTPGHFVTDCIDCMKQRSRNQVQTRMPVWETNTMSEQIVIDALMKRGIGATTGKVANAPDVDVVAWGWVNIECKYSGLKHTKGTGRSFKFVTTPKQQKRGFLAHIVILVCEYPDGDVTFHMFGNRDPYFYKKDGSVKTGFTFTPDRYRKSNAGFAGHHPLTQEVMDAHKGNWNLIWQKLDEISDQFKSGFRPEYGKLFDIAA